MKLYLVRHGKTRWNTLGVAQGWADVSMNAEGVFQCLKLREELRAIKFSACFSSPLKRAAQTAQISLGYYVPNKDELRGVELEQMILSEKMLKNSSETMSKNKEFRCPIFYNEDLMERGLGVFDGEKMGTAISAMSWRPDFDAMKYEMESVQHLYNRVNRFLDNLRMREALRYGPEANFLLVSHGGVAKMIDYCLNGGEIADGKISDIEKYKKSLLSKIGNAKYRVYEI